MTGRAAAKTETPKMPQMPRMPQRSAAKYGLTAEAIVPVNLPGPSCDI